MFDDIRCLYPLPVDGANKLDYQTKDTPAQFCDQYEIREDGTLWHEDYDTEDRSDRGKWMTDNPGKEPPEIFDTIGSWCGCMTRVNRRWVQVAFRGELQFYTNLGKTGWIEWSAYFVDGKLNQIHLSEHRKEG